MAFFEAAIGDMTSYITSTNVTAPVATYSNGVPTYSSGGVIQGSCLKLDTGTAGVLDVVGCGVGDNPVGVLVDFGVFGAVGPGIGVQVQFRGKARCVAGAAITVGQLVYVTDTSGRVGPAPAAGATGAWLVGQAETAATQVGDYVTVRLLLGSQQLIAS